MAAPVGPKKVPRYTLEFKIQAVKLANDQEIQTQDVAHAGYHSPVEFECLAHAQQRVHQIG